MHTPADNVSEFAAATAPRRHSGPGRHFVQKYRNEIGRMVRGLSREAEAVLINCDWPGNVRELQNVISRGFRGFNGWVESIRPLEI